MKYGLWHALYLYIYINISCVGGLCVSINGFFILVVRFPITSSLSDWHFIFWLRIPLDFWSIQMVTSKCLYNIVFFFLVFLPFSFLKMHWQVACNVINCTYVWKYFLLIHLINFLLFSSLIFDSTSTKKKWKCQKWINEAFQIPSEFCWIYIYLFKFRYNIYWKIYSGKVCGNSETNEIAFQCWACNHFDVKMNLWNNPHCIHRLMHWIEEKNEHVHFRWILKLLNVCL